MARDKNRVPPFVVLGEEHYVVVGWDRDGFPRRGDPLILRPLTPKERATRDQVLGDAYEEAFARTEGYAADRREEEGE